MSTGLEVHALRGADALQRAQADWLVLAQQDEDAGLFQSLEMARAWHDHSTSTEQPLLLLVRQGNRPVGLLPLREHSMAVMRGLHLRTLASLSPRADALAVGDRDAVARAWVGWLQGNASRWDLLELEDLRPATAQRLQAGFAGQRHCSVDGPRPAPAESFITTQGGWQGYLNERGAHFRHRLKPQTRKIERLGTVSLRHFVGPQAAQPYEEFLRLEPRSWKSRADQTRLPDRERQAFAALIRQAGAVQPDLLFLDVDGKPVAAMLSLACRGVYHLFVTYFDDSLRAWYPGRRLFLESIQYAFGQPGVHEINFVGAYPFARAWAGGVRDHCHLRVWRHGWRARCARWLASRNASAPPTEPTMPEMEPA